MVVVRVKFIPTSDGNVNVEIDNFLQSEDDSVEDAPSLRGVELHTLTWDVDRTSFGLALSGKGTQSFYEFNINVDRNTSMSELFSPHVETFLTVLPEMYKVYIAFRSSVVHAHISNFKDVKARKNREEEILKIWQPKINDCEKQCQLLVFTQLSKNNKGLLKINQLNNLARIIVSSIFEADIMKYFETPKKRN